MQPERAERAFHNDSVVASIFIAQTHNHGRIQWPRFVALDHTKSMKDEEEKGEGAEEARRSRFCVVFSRGNGPCF